MWLGHQLKAPVRSLSHGEQRQLELGLARVTDPRRMMLDEPASGLSRGEREQLTQLLMALDPAVTLILIEHDMDVALNVARRVTIQSLLGKRKTRETSWLLGSHSKLNGKPSLLFAQVRGSFLCRAELALLRVIVGITRMRFPCWRSDQQLAGNTSRGKIGRASCRERVL